MTSGGEALIRALSDEKIDIIFGYPGGAALHIYDAKIFLVLETGGICYDD